jgi:SAM-dependent methyltransferase
VNERSLLLEPDLYARRFGVADDLTAQAIWKPITEYLQRYVPKEGVTLDLGAGRCVFINSILSREKIAVDVDERQLKEYAGPLVRRIVACGDQLNMIADASVDAVFASNIYEHFPSRESVAASLRETYRILRRDGRLIVMQPNFRYCMARYSDFFDHRLAFTHEAMVEGITMVGFEVERVVPRFLPYSTKGALPKHPKLVEWYLRIPLVWRIFGAQMLIVARKPELSSARSMVYEIP